MKKRLYISLLCLSFLTSSIELVAQSLGKIVAANKSSAAWLSQEFESDELANVNLPTLRERLWAGFYFDFDLQEIRVDSLNFTELTIGHRQELKASIRPGKELDSLLRSHRLKPKIYKQLTKADLQQLPKELATLLAELDAASFPFASLSLKSNPINSEELILNIEVGPKYYLDSIIVKGDQDFPVWMYEKITGLNIGQAYSQRAINGASNSLATIKHLEIIQEPAVLFTKNGAIPFFYLNNKSANQVNGLIGIGTNPQGKILLSGGFDLRLENNLNKLELLEIAWKRNETEYQEFSSTLAYPYILKSNLGVKAKAKLIKQDSSFIRRDFGAGLSYRFNPKEELIFSGNRKLHNGLGSNSFSIKQASYELRYIRNSLQGFPLRKKGSLLDIAFSGGNRIENSLKPKSVIEWQLMFQKIIPINFKNQLVYELNIQGIEANQLRPEESIYFGGLESLRGKRENDLISSSLALNRIEYRWLWQANSFAFASFDLLNRKESAPIRSYAMGVGLPAGKGIFILAYAISEQLPQGIKLDEGLVHLAWQSSW